MAAVLIQRVSHKYGSGTHSHTQYVVCSIGTTSSLPLSRSRLNTYITIAIRYTFECYCRVIKRCDRSTTQTVFKIIGQRRFVFSYCVRIDVSEKSYKSQYGTSSSLHSDRFAPTIICLYIRINKCSVYCLNK